jgi:ribosome-associated protein
VTDQETLQCILKAAGDVKAENPVILNLQDLTSFADYFVILSGRSDRQVQAIADRIIEELKKNKIKPLGLEGTENKHWILIDYGHIVVHVFYEETREFYALEQLWNDASKVEVNTG